MYKVCLKSRALSNSRSRISQTGKERKPHWPVFPEKFIDMRKIGRGWVDEWAGQPTSINLAKVQIITRNYRKTGVNGV